MGGTGLLMVVLSGVLRGELSGVSRASWLSVVGVVSGVDGRGGFCRRLMLWMVARHGSS